MVCRWRIGASIQKKEALHEQVPYFTPSCLGTGCVSNGGFYRTSCDSRGRNDWGSSRSGSDSDWGWATALTKQLGESVLCPVGKPPTPQVVGRFGAIEGVGMAVHHLRSIGREIDFCVVETAQGFTQHRLK